jgi:hypothetical protein
MTNPVQIEGLAFQSSWLARLAVLVFAIVIGIPAAVLVLVLALVAAVVIGALMVVRAIAGGFQRHFPRNDGRSNVRVIAPRER